MENESRAAKCRLRSGEHVLQRAWDEKRARQTCKRGHPFSAASKIGTVRRCAICDRMHQLIVDSKFRIGPVLLRPPRPTALKTHCPSGHPYSGSNLRINRKGGKVCRACANASVTKWKTEKAARGENPDRGKPREATIQRIFAAAERGLLRSELIGRSNRVAATVSPNTLINIRLWFPERWQTLTEQFARNRGARAKPTILRPKEADPLLVPIHLSDAEAAELMRNVYRLMPKGLARDHRDDAVFDLLEDVIKGKLPLANVNSKTARAYSSKQYRENHDSWGPLSLDAARNDDGFSLMDRLEEGTGWTAPVSLGRRIGSRRYA